MKAKRIAGKVARSIPVAGGYIRNNEKVIKELQTAIAQLQARNDEWEAEVRAMRKGSESMHILWPVKEQDLIDADYRQLPKQAKRKAKPPYTISWVIPPIGETSGGHTTIFRAIQHLESQGHNCTVYVYDPMKQGTAKQTKERVEHNLPKIKGQVYYEQPIKDCDALFATAWTTAYPVFNFKGSAKKYYFVQDYEPYFEPVGTYSTLAQNTYHFGLRGITIGNWLSQKLPKEFGMKCDPIEFGVNSEEFKLLDSSAKRKKILFYARPVTPRRGFELGVLALQIFHKRHPDYEIHFLGWDTSPYVIPFPYVNNGIMSLDKLNELYNECAAGLVLSFTNMSLLPLEMLASGCVPVVNDADHTRAVSFSKEIKYAPPTPQALADELHTAVTVKDPQVQAERASNFAKKFKWTDSMSGIDKILRKEL